MSDVQRDHIRRLDLPWRELNLTECGRPVSDVAASISRDEIVARVKKDGIQRAAYSTCMTCLETVQRWPSWDQNPAQFLAREIGHYGRPNEQIVRELRAIALLVEAHRDEFDGLVEGLQNTVDLAARRKAKRTRSVASFAPRRPS